MDTVELKLDEENSLTFEISIEGEAPTNPVYRLVCEGDDVSYSFRGTASEGGVEFTVPPLQNKLKEGSYESHLEVIIENKLLIPLQFTTNFAVATKVFVESVKVGNKTTKPAPVSAAAKLIKVGEKPQKQPIISKVKKETATVVEAIKAPKKEEKKQVTLRELYQRKNRENK